MKKTIGIVLSVLVILGSVTIFSAEAAVKIKDKTLRAYTSHAFTLKKSSSVKYYCKVTNNSKKNISVSFKDNGSTYSLKTIAKKVTGKKKPVVKIYYKNASNKKVVIKIFRYKVTPPGTVKFKSIKMNNGTSENVALKNPFAYSYKIKRSNPEVIEFKAASGESGSNLSYYRAKALKEGSSTISVYIKGTAEKVGSFTITSGNYKTVIDPKYTTLNLKYNSHGSSTYMEASHANVADMLMYKHAGAKYYVNIADESIADVVSDTIIYSAGKGSTTATVYETLKNKTKTVGKITVKSNSAAMAYVAKQNALFYDNILFGYGDNTEFLSLTGTKAINIRPTIIKRLLNNSFTNSHFKSSEYKITYKSTNSKVAKVISTGKVTAVKKGSARIYFTITFSDKSTYKYYCRIIVE